MTPSTRLAAVPSEPIAQAAAMLLVAGKVRVLESGSRVFFADVQGSERDPYTTSYGYPTADAWHCTCKGHVLGGNECRHIVACDRIWQPEPPMQRPKLSLIRHGFGWGSA